MKKNKSNKSSNEIISERDGIVANNCLEFGTKVIEMQVGTTVSSVPISSQPINYKKYCKKCGAKLANVICNYYDEYTGEKIHDTACSNETCEKHCDFWGHEYRNRFWFPILYEAKCIKCRYVPQDY